MGAQGRTDLRARRVGHLLLERAWLEPRLEDALDGAGVVSVVAHRMLEGGDDVVGRPGELQAEDVRELRPRVALALTQPRGEGLGHLAPGGEPFGEQREIVALPFAGFAAS